MSRWRRRSPSDSAAEDGTSIWAADVEIPDRAPVDWSLGSASSIGSDDRSGPEGSEPTDAAPGDDAAAPVVPPRRNRWRVAAVGAAAVAAIGVAAVATTGGGSDGDVRDGAESADGRDDLDPSEDPTPTTLGTLPPADSDPVLPDVPAPPPPFSGSDGDPSTGGTAAEFESTSEPPIRPSVTSEVTVDLPDALGSAIAPYEILAVVDDGRGDGRLATLSLPSGRLRSVPLPSLGLNGASAAGMIVAPDAALIGRWDGSPIIVPRSGSAFAAGVGDASVWGGGVAGVETAADGSSRFLVDRWDQDGITRVAIDLDGEVEETGLRTRTSGTPLVDGGALVGDAGGVYRVEGDGTAARLSDGMMLTVSEPWVFVRECDAEYRCGYAAIRLDGASRVEFDPAVDDIFETQQLGRVAIAAGGDAVAAIEVANSPDFRVSIATADGEISSTTVPGPGWEASLAWEPTGLGVFVAAQSSAPSLILRDGELVDLSAVFGPRVMAIGVRPVEQELPAIPAAPELTAELSAIPPVDLVGIDGSAAVHLDLAPNTSDATDEGAPLPTWRVPAVVGVADLVPNGDGVIVIAPNGVTAYRTRVGEVTAVYDGDPIPGPRFATPDGRLTWRPDADDERFELVPTTFLDGAGRTPWKVIDVTADDVYGSDGAGGLVYRADDDVFVATGGSTTLLTSGELVAIGPSAAVVSECDDTGTCVSTLIDRDTDERAPLTGPLVDARSLEPASRRPSDGTISPDGEVVVVVLPSEFGGDGSERLGFVDLDTTTIVAAPFADRAQPIHWTDDSSFAFYVTKGFVQVFDRAAGRVVSLTDAGQFGSITIVDAAFGDR